MIIQQPVSRYKSIKLQLANRVWAFGPSAIFVEGVPFSLRSGQMYANRLLQIFLTLDHNKDHIEIAEFGPGLGFLSLHFLDALKAYDPSIYNKTTLYLVDPLKHMLDPLAHSHAFKRHKSVVKFVQRDASNLPKQWAELDFAFSTNLLDSFEQRHFEVKNGNIYEIMVQTSVKEQAAIMDTTQNIPTMLSPSDIKQMLADKPINNLELSLAARLLEGISETFIQTPLEDVPTLNEDVKKDISQKVKHLIDKHGTKTFSFNYSPSFDSHIQTVIQNLAPNGGYVLSDFGFANQLVQYPPEHLVTSYGVSQFYTVCFPLISQIVEQNNAYSIITNHDLDETQDMLITAKPASAQLKQTFSEQLEAFDFKDVSTKMEQIFTDTDSKIADKLDTLLGVLNKEEKEDYYFLKTIGFQLFAEKENDQAVAFAEGILEKHDDMGIDGFLLKGWVLQEQHDHQKAIEFFDKVLNFCPFHAVAHASKGLSFLVLGNNIEAGACFKKAIYYSHSNNIWQWVFGLAQCLRRQEKFEEAESWLRFPLSIESVDIIHPSIKEKFKQSV